MSTLSAIEKSKFERLFNMGGGYVMKFTNGSFGIFFSDFDIDIHSDAYRSGGPSKANKLRTFWSNEEDHLVGRVLSGLVEYYLEYNPDSDAARLAEVD